MLLFLVGIRILIWMLSLPTVRPVLFANKDEVARVNWHLNQLYPVPDTLTLAPVAKSPWFRKLAARVLKLPPPPEAEPIQAEPGRAVQAKPIDPHVAAMAAAYAKAEAIKWAGTLGATVLASAIAFAFG